MNNRNRGKNTGDDSLFSFPKQIEKMKSAVEDMNYLLSRNYAERASSELVGHHYRLKTRQIQAIRGAAASELKLKKETLKNLAF